MRSTAIIYNISSIIFISHLSSFILHLSSIIFDLSSLSFIYQLAQLEEYVTWLQHSPASGTAPPPPPPPPPPPLEADFSEYGEYASPPPPPYPGAYYRGGDAAVAAGTEIRVEELQREVGRLRALEDLTPQMQVRVHELPPDLEPFDLLN